MSLHLSQTHIWVILITIVLSPTLSYLHTFSRAGPKSISSSIVHLILALCCQAASLRSLPQLSTRSQTHPLPCNLLLHSSLSLALPSHLRRARALHPTLSRKTTSCRTVVELLGRRGVARNFAASLTITCSQTSARWHGTEIEKDLPFVLPHGFR